MEPKIARIGLAEFAAEREALVALLTDTVESGAAVGFLPPLDAETADAYWTSVGAAIGQSGRTLFGLWAAGVLAATVQLQRASMPNGRHRGEVMKLMVHRRYRGRGFAGMLMSAMEAEARRQGLRLLVLDTRQGDTAEGLYRKLGWQESGVIPGYAESADGSLHATVIFYKELR